MRYIVKATKLTTYDPNTSEFLYTVYDGQDFRRAKKKMLEHAEYGGVQFETRDD